MFKNELGLALSGGGYRAAAFHLGTLRALHTLNALDKFDVISTISGGSITGAAWALYRNNKLQIDGQPVRFQGYPFFEQFMIKTLNEKSVIGFVLSSWTFLRIAIPALLLIAVSLYVLFCTSYPWISLVIIVVLVFVFLRFQFRLFPVSKEIERAYDRFFFSKQKLEDLPARPDLAIGSTNVLTTTPFTFSHRKMGDSYYSKLDPPVAFKHNRFPIARAVVASSCVPFAFTPVTIGKEFFEPERAYIDTKLIDGGVFDNQGIHKVTNDKSSWGCRVVVVSDAGNKLPFDQAYVNTISLLIRTVDVFMDRIKDFQMAQNLYRRVSGAKEEIAFISLGWDYDRCIDGFFRNMEDGTIPAAVIASHGFHPAWISAPSKFKNEITSHLAKNTGYTSKLGDENYQKSLAIARSVGTNLTKLSITQINALSYHAEISTLLQIKLYCPSI